MLSVQKNYLVARAALKALDELETELEREYMLKHSIVNEDGSVPIASWAIDDDAIADKAIEECSQLLEDSGLYKQILDARKTLKEAENALLDYGLSVLPDDERKVLQEAVTRNTTVRQKVLDLACRVDVT